MSRKRQAKKVNEFRPSDFMRARRPYLFSDTEVAEEARLDRSTFALSPGTLTQRKQELDFERFARKLSEKEICPNLLPQTGPTGGGDSKVDSETYPVASEVSERWYYADTKGSQGTTERWAFAFSAKEKWKDKVYSDIKSIAGTGRGYTKAYFITSRAVKDKDRAAVEDDLRKTYGIDVRILDRTWIIEKVFSNRRETLAIETLKLSVPLAPSPKKGPRDTSREAELNELETEITDPERYQGLDYQLVEDALQAALLARGLEVPRVEVDGRFERASRFAEERGTTQQQLRCAYQRAWTYFWWYDDFSSFNRQYDLVERLAQDSSQISDTELLKNLWQLLYTSVERNHIDPPDAKLPERTALLEGELARLQKEQGRPSVALHARASQLLMELTKAHTNPEQLKKVLRGFREVFEKSRGLIDFPAQEFIEVLTDLGEYFTDDAKFDEVFESLLEIARERQSVAVSGRMLLRRGIQKLKGKKPYEAIRLLGRAQQHLAMHESRGEMALALGLCANAYEAVGLLWAARGGMLLAANQALKEFWERGNITGQALSCVRRMIWIELQLGRVPCALAWVEVFFALNGAAQRDAERQRRLEEEWMYIDGSLGYLLLHTDIFDLKNLGFLPNVLEHLHFDASWMALLYALGYEERLRKEEAIPADEMPEGVQDFFDKWAAQPGLSDLPAPEFLDKQTVELHSNVLGCEVTVSLPNDNNSLFWAEAILAGLEAFLATSLQAAAPHTATLQINIVPRDFMTEALEFTVDTVPRTAIEVRYRKYDSAFEDDSETVKDKLMELISTITGYIAMPPADAMKFFENLIRDERGFGRALLITSVKTMIGNILGSRPKIRISDWDANGSFTESFPLVREQPWVPAARATPEEVEAKAPTVGKGESPPEMFDVERLKHRDRKVFSLINIDLWNKANWSGTGYITSEDPDEAPFLALIFKDPKAAAAIFQGWKEEVGKQDSAERIRVSIITGVSRKNPAAYRVLVSANPDWSPARKDKVDHFVIVARINEMNPKDSSNLDRFLESYHRKKQYVLVPGQLGSNGLGGWARDLKILKNELNVRPAWQIGAHDPDMVAIHDDDDVIIPEGVTDAPVLGAIARKKRRSESAGAGAETMPESSHGKIGRNDPCHCGSGKKFKKCHGR